MLQIDLGCCICCKAYVSSVLSVLDVCLVFYMDVVYVTMALYTCFKHMFQVFQTHVANVLSRCCKIRSRCCICCCEYTLMFQAYVSSVSSVSDVCCKCFICFRRMLQMFHLDISKVDLVEHMFHLPQPPYCCHLGAPPWVTIRVPDAGRRLRGTHTQAG
jgi:hypothetical protein